MKCHRCNNEDESLFAMSSKGMYCRACVGFKRIIVQEDIIVEKQVPPVCDSDYLLEYSLTKYQKEISKQICDNIFDTDILLHGVTGSGKTEMILELIEKCLKEKISILIVISRRQVVLEISERLSHIFKNCKVTPICQGYTSDLDGDIIVATSHQCYRFIDKIFEIVIVDEVDAFPLKGDLVLNNIVQNCCSKHLLYLTATPDEYFLNKIKNNEIMLLKIVIRPHYHNLVVPQVVLNLKFVLYYFLYCFIKQRIKTDHLILIFVPTIKMCKKLNYLFKYFKCDYLTSKTKNKEEIIDKFKNKQINVLFATTILERGVTFTKVDVCVFMANHMVFDESSLIQIAGRVGRKIKAPTGDCLFLCDGVSDQVNKCVKSIIGANDEKMSLVSKNN